MIGQGLQLKQNLAIGTSAAEQIFSANCVIVNFW